MMQRFMNTMRRRMPACQRAIVLLSAAMDRRLSLRERLALRMHVMMCRSCERYHSHLRLLRAAVRHHACLTQDVALSPAARERLEYVLRHAL